MAKKYGVDNPAKSPLVYDKIIKTNIKRYGGPSHMFDKKIFYKVQKNSFKSKNHSSGIYYRGTYEEDFLNKFSSHFIIENPPGIKYLFNNCQKIYYPDFYIPELNLIIEIKNSYLLRRDADIIKAKNEACLEAGFNFILIIDKDYNKFSNLLSNSL